jgi:hypothetical protein
MRAHAEAQAEDDGEDPEQLRAQHAELGELEDVEDEVEPQNLTDLRLGMEVRDGQGGDGAGLGG